MSQRNSGEINKVIEVTLKLKVTLNSFSTHDGFTGSAHVDAAVCEFESNIKNELEKQITGDFNSEFLFLADFVDYTVSS